MLHMYMRLCRGVVWLTLPMGEDSTAEMMSAKESVGLVSRCRDRRALADGLRGSKSQGTSWLLVMTCSQSECEKRSWRALLAKRLLDSSGPAKAAVNLVILLAGLGRVAKGSCQCEP